VSGVSYLLPYCVPAAVVAGSLYGAVWPFRLAPAIFFAAAVVDTLLARRRSAPSPEPAPDAPIRHLAVALWLPAQAAIVVCGAITIVRGPIGPLEALAVVVSVGMTGGMLNVPAAHELMHRPGRLPRAMAEVLMALLTYPHFCVEHLHGHHVRVATPDDPATARRGESVYAFWPRAVIGGAMSAWRLEAGRMRAHGLAVPGIHNRVVRGVVGTAALYAAVAIAFGTAGVLFFAAQSLVGIATLETVNYVQHYGLARRRGLDGRYERVTPMHAWNSNEAVSNWFVLNLGYHSDHHCDSRKRYWSLGCPEDAPRLPTGLFGMFVLALFPPLWRAIMDPLVDRLNAPEHRVAIT
jgi:alkane 1-monooxygenase